MILSLFVKEEILEAREAAINKPEIIVMGWIFAATNFSASLKSSPAKTTTEVVPSPTSSSWTLDISVPWIKDDHQMANYNFYKPNHGL